MADRIRGRRKEEKWKTNTMQYERQPTSCEILLNRKKNLKDKVIIVQPTRK